MIGRHQRFITISLMALLLFMWVVYPRLANAALLQDCSKVTTMTVGDQQQSYVTNDCTLDDFVAQFVTLAKYGLGLVGVLATLMLVYAGVQYLTAGGRTEKVTAGNKIITGTIVGVVIALSAYVIINFIVMALTGNTKMIKGGQPIAILFGGTISGEKTPELERPFSGVGGTYYACRDPKNTRWDKSCDNHILCADQANTEGEITKLQKALNAKGCGCGEVDGCFGAATLNCVRRFQHAQNQPMTGTVDTLLKSSIEASVTKCNPLSATITAALPSPSLDNLSTSQNASETTGCCVVGKPGNGGNNVYYCENGVSDLACSSMSQLAPAERFFSGTTCMNSEAAKKVCGFCRDASGFAAAPTNRCFQYAGQYWCKNIGKPSQSTEVGGVIVPGELIFYPGKSCEGETTLCAGTRGCINQLLITPR